MGNCLALLGVRDSNEGGGLCRPGKRDKLSALEVEASALADESQESSVLRGEGRGRGVLRLCGVDKSNTFYVLRKTEDVHSRYHITVELGKGQFGRVCAAIDRVNGNKVAVKSISKRSAEVQANFRKDIQTEIQILYTLTGHQNVVQLFEVYEDAESIHLVLELCQGKDWFERLLKHGTYSEEQAADTMRTLLHTLQYIHSLGVVHRDIKPENLLFSDFSDTATVKLADFGLSAMFQCADQQLQDPVGSTYYVAPEVLKDRGYGRECDVWSLGVVLFVILSGYAPFEGANEDKVFQAIMYKPLRFADETWNDISGEARDVVSRMLVKDPKRRATIPELLRHPWFVESKAAGRARAVPDTVVQRLQQFAAMHAFKRQARKVLARLLPEEELVGLRNLFREMDANGDGVLTLVELRDAISTKGLSLPEAQAKSLLDCIDLNANGVIDYEEFLAATVHQIRLDKDELLFKAFQHFDKDGNGFISREELALALEGQGVDIQKVLRDVDTDNDGQVNYQEFCECMRNREEYVEAPGGASTASATHDDDPDLPPLPPVNLRLRNLAGNALNRSRGLRNSTSRGRHTQQHQVVRQRPQSAAATTRQHAYPSASAAAAAAVDPLGVRMRAGADGDDKALPSLRGPVPGGLSPLLTASRRSGNRANIAAMAKALGIHVGGCDASPDRADRLSCPEPSGSRAAGSRAATGQSASGLRPLSAQRPGMRMGGLTGHLPHRSSAHASTSSRAMRAPAGYTGARSSGGGGDADADGDPAADPARSRRATSARPRGSTASLRPAARQRGGRALTARVGRAGGGSRRGGDGGGGGGDGDGGSAGETGTPDSDGACRMGSPFVSEAGGMHSSRPDLDRLFLVIIEEIPFGGG
ncbi:hypothetical protein FOA52_011872 [Chlamydomonas sp. UWO 241]|nr:hypothetical protein FOA52_011872 [Chlamydomonas sp. UWO 241]